LDHKVIKVQLVQLDEDQPVLQVHKDLWDKLVQLDKLAQLVSVQLVVLGRKDRKERRAALLGLLVVLVLQDQLVHKVFRELLAVLAQQVLQDIKAQLVPKVLLA
jgi:hypothetical protein